MPEIEVRLHAMLRDRLPPGSRGVTGRISLPAPVTILDILNHLAIPTELRQLAVLNDEEIRPERWATIELSDGDRLSVFPPIAGGCGLAPPAEGSWRN